MIRRAKIIRKCPDCKGTGIIFMTDRATVDCDCPCSVCKGTGKISEEVEIVFTNDAIEDGGE